jgi:hypothetical protein
VTPPLFGTITVVNGLTFLREFDAGGEAKAQYFRLLVGLKAVPFKTEPSETSSIPG